MSGTCSRDLIFRPAFPDEESRARYFDGDRPPIGRSCWFLAITSNPVERIVGSIRFAKSDALAGHREAIDFRLVAGPGCELAGREQDFLESFAEYLSDQFQGRLRHMPLIPEGHPWNKVFASAGFEIGYREYHLAAPVEALATRAAKSYRALQRHPSPLAAGKIVPVRECKPDAAIALLEATRLMEEAAIRAVWYSEDATRLDRDISSCFMLDGELLGVVLAADGGADLKVIAIAVHEEVPGAKLWGTPLLMHHLFQASADRHYRQALFRANAGTAPTTFNFAKRAGGEITADLRRWVREIA